MFSVVGDGTWLDLRLFVDCYLDHGDIRAVSLSDFLMELAREELSFTISKAV